MFSTGGAAGGGGLFGGGGNTGTTGLFGTSAAGAATVAAQPAISNPMNDIVVNSPPDDTVTSLRFSPPAISTHFLASSSWDNRVRCWELSGSQANPKAEQMLTAPILGCCWHSDGSKIFTGDCENKAKMWDLGSNQVTQVGQHDAPIKSVHWVQAANYSCLMTASWDKTIKFWDTRTPNPIGSMTLPERAYCADVVFPMAVVSTADKGIFVYILDPQPKEYKKIDSPLKFQHRCVSIFKDQTGGPTGFALGSIEGRVAIQYVDAKDPKDNFTFKCHRVNPTDTTQDIYAVNDISFHPTHNTLVTVGSDGRFSFWDKDARTKIKTSEQFNNPVSACTFSHDGSIFAYSTGYDWSQGHEGNDLNKKPQIYLRPALEELKPRSKISNSR